MTGSINRRLAVALTLVVAGLWAWRPHPPQRLRRQVVFANFRCRLVV